MPPPPKSEAAPAAAAAPAKAPAKPEAAAEAPAAAAPAAAPARSALMSWLPAIAVVLLAPVATWAAVEFVVLPRLQKKIAAMPAQAAAPEAGPASSGGHGEKGKDGKAKEGGGAPNYEFVNVVVNLSGTMGTRYLKTNVYVTGKEPNLKGIFEADKPRLTDITQAVLSSLTLAEIEETGARNIIRAKLINAYNEALRRKVVEEVYLTDFVVQ